MTTPAVPRRLRLAVFGDYTSHWKEQVEPTPAQQPMTSDEFGLQYRLLKQMAVKEGRSYTAEHVPSGRAVLVHILEEDRVGGPTGLRTLLDGLGPRDRSRVLDTITVDNSLVVVTQFLQDFDGLVPWLRDRSAGPVAPPPTPGAPPQEGYGEFTRLFRSSENMGAPPVTGPPPGLEQPSGEVPRSGSNFTDLFRAPVMPPDQTAPGGTIPSVRMVGVRVPLPSEPALPPPPLHPPESPPDAAPPRLTPNFETRAGPAPELAGWPRPDEVVIPRGEPASAPVPQASWGAPSEYTRMFGSVPQPTGELAQPLSPPEPPDEQPERKRSYLPLFLILNLVFILATGIILYFVLRRC
jgi:hypothetical protein